MSKNELKALIIRLRDNGCSYGEISNVLKSEYGIEMSRQSVCGMYTRSVSKGKEKEVNRLDVVMYSVLGYSPLDIREILKDNTEYSLSAMDIKDIIAESRELIKENRDRKVRTLARALYDGTDNAGVNNILSYNNRVAKKDEYRQLLCDATEIIMRELAATTYAQLFKATGNRDIVKKAMNQVGLEISFREIGKQA